MPPTVPIYKSLQDPQYMKDLLLRVPVSEINAFKQYIGIPQDIINHPYFSSEKRLDWVVLEQFTNYIIHVCEEEETQASKATGSPKNEAS